MNHETGSELYFWCDISEMKRIIRHQNIGEQSFNDADHLSSTEKYSSFLYYWLSNGCFVYMVVKVNRTQIFFRPYFKVPQTALFRELVARVNKWSRRVIHLWYWGLCAGFMITTKESLLILTDNEVYNLSYISHPILLLKEDSNCSLIIENLALWAWREPQSAEWVAGTLPMS